MKIDKHHDPYGDLENKLVRELEGIAHQLGGTLQKISKRDSMGRNSKVIQIEYDVTHE
tara:strand:- start:241 stop:414 length:174 start_codon:yes stop_codon:yes gene_type:complete